MSRVRCSLSREGEMGWEVEYKSRTMLLGLPLVHISFEYRLNHMPVPEKGMIAIGQFGMGIITVSQFEIVSISICKFRLQCLLIVQVGLYIQAGCGQLV